MPRDDTAPQAELRRHGGNCSEYGISAAVFSVDCAGCLSCAPIAFGVCTAALGGGRGGRSGHDISLDNQNPPPSSRMSPLPLPLCPSAPLPSLPASAPAKYKSTPNLSQSEAVRPLPGPRPFPGLGPPRPAPSRQAGYRARVSCRNTSSHPSTPTLPHTAALCLPLCPPPQWRPLQCPSSTTPTPTPTPALPPPLPRLLPLPALSPPSPPASTTSTPSPRASAPMTTPRSTAAANAMHHTYAGIGPPTSLLSVSPPSPPPLTAPPSSSTSESAS